jgi:mRNA interferase RelE/StbE
LRTQKQPAEYSKQSVKYLGKLEAKVQEGLEKAILEIPAGNIKPLKGYDNCFRLDIILNKVSYRILFEWISDEQIQILKIKPRGDVYKGGF